MDPRSVKFLYDGAILHPESTPESLHMEDDDEIDAMLTQVGGAFVVICLNPCFWKPPKVNQMLKCLLTQSQFAAVQVDSVTHSTILQERKFWKPVRLQFETQSGHIIVWIGR